MNTGNAGSDVHKPLAACLATFLHLPETCGKLECTVGTLYLQPKVQLLHRAFNFLSVIELHGYVSEPRAGLLDLFTTAS